MIVHRVQGEQVVLVLEQLHKVVDVCWGSLDLILVDLLLTLIPNFVKVSLPLVSVQINEVVSLSPGHFGDLVFEAFLELLLM
jgi:hypothetical protein